MSFILNLVCLPGYIIVWCNYYFPKGGFVGVAESRRQYKNKKTFAVFYSASFYLLCFLLYITFWQGV